MTAAAHSPGGGRAEGLAAALARDGFVRLGAVLDAATAEALRGACDRLRGDGAPASAYGVIRHDAWRLEPAFERALRGGPLPDLARAALGVPRVVLFQDHVVWKPPGTTAEVSWHQDDAYWPLEARGLTLWVALDAADEGNGCLRYLPGTHRLGRRAPTDFTPGAAQPRRDDLPPLDAAARAGEAVAAPAAAGEALAHDPLVWHMSPPNPSARHRRAWSITLVTEDARWAPDRAPHPLRWSLAPAAGAPLDPARFPRL